MMRIFAESDHKANVRSQLNRLERCDTAEQEMEGGNSLRKSKTDRKRMKNEG